ncbi:hypothetical protein Dsin_016331 [Dipteronia sinensis]|uniref:NB-ARC domain-containing protein n=1 Tax=Dipteronia sinensis TaxID=43782 RepID=A0AAE0E5W6_9ROSI|nr:hypothetical protein Dsin_016331 [Dipteronia sinensis]
MGGIGKTTIARAIFNRITNQFEAVCFLANIHRKKILVVLDDVDDSEHLKFLMGDHLSLFGLGSRIIVTSRDRQVLKNDVHEVYEVA